jgi:hypothetical protein
MEHWISSHAGLLPGQLIFFVILRSRSLARRLEGSPQALVAHPSRLAVKNGEHLRMTVECS